MTHKELEGLVGDKVDRKLRMLLVGDDLYHQLEDGSWERYAAYPKPEEAR